ncbi:MAG TPA: hypothetical protein VHV77_04900, partial [Pirellulales bacterium]|nr:hypothetical protein [Pirellulales bacterium]
MSAVRVGLCLLVIVHTWLGEPAGAHAQQPPAASPGAATSGPAEGVQEAKPDLFYLKDKDGKLEPVLGFTLEDFERLMTLGTNRDAALAKPTYRLDRVAVKGNVAGDRARLTADFTIHVDTDNWVRVPLRLTEAVVHGKARYQGGGEHFLEYDDDENQYIAWVRGSSEKPHQISLDILAPLTTVAGETRLKLSVPRAMESEMDLYVPVAGVNAQVSAPAFVDATTPDGDGTRFRVVGLTNDFSLSYRRGMARSVELPTVLEGTGAMLVRLDGRSVHTQAQLTVRSYGGPFETFRVRLPAGAVLISGDQPDYTVKTVSEPRAPADARGKSIVEVRLRTPSVGPVSVRLSTAQSFKTAGIAADGDARPIADEKRPPGDPVQLGGFEIVGAVRQWGHLAVQVVGDWQVTWVNRQQVRQVEDVPTELWRDDLLACFEYFTQPFVLAARVLPRPTRIGAEIQDVALVGSSRVDLESRLKYRISGSKAFSVAIDLKDWKFDEVLPNANIKLDEIGVPGDDALLTIPLARPSTGNVEIVVRCHRDLGENVDQLDFALPKPRATILESGTLVVQPDDNVDVLPLADKLEGLVPQAGRVVDRLPQRQQPPLVYSSSGAQAQFAASIRVFQRTVTLAQSAAIDLGQAGFKVMDQLDFDVAREPLDIVSLQVPSRVIDDGNLEFSLGENSLPWTVVGQSEDDDDLSPVEVTLPGPRIGRFAIVARYELSEPPVEPHSTASVSVPLLVPTNLNKSTHQVTVNPEPDVRFQVVDALWHARRHDGPERTVQVASTTARPTLALGVSLRENRSAAAPTVERAWVQSWLGEHSRQDRAVFRVTSDDPHVAVALPSGIAAIEVLVDGNRVSPEEGSTLEQLSIALPAREQSPATWTVEMRYRFVERKAHATNGAVTLQAPTVDKKAWPRRLFWQIVLPSDEHLWDTPAGFTSENVVGWETVAWDTRP